MFTIEWVYGSKRLFNTQEEAEQFAASRMDGQDKCVISEVKKVIKVAPKAVETIEVPLSEIQDKDCECIEEGAKALNYSP